MSLVKNKSAASNSAGVRTFGYDRRAVLSCCVSRDRMSQAVVQSNLLSDKHFPIRSQIADSELSRATMQVGERSSRWIVGARIVVSDGYGFRESRNQVDPVHQSWSC